ncbi:hypothetical protein [Streptomyces sp. NPDC002346]
MLPAQVQAPDDTPAALDAGETPGGFAGLPGLGPGTTARIPADAQQLVLVTGRDKNSSRSHVTLYRRTASGWQGGASWPAHNVLKGWTTDHHLNDLRSPTGVFTLSDAGGLLPGPGSKLPYTRSGGSSVGGTGFEGEPLAGSFDYVIAIDYNRVRGTSPLDWTRPQGAGKGGGVWLYEGAHHGCAQSDTAAYDPAAAERHWRELLALFARTL